MTYSKIGNFLKQKREEAGLSQKQLGQNLSPPVTTQFISNMERGITPIPLNHAVNLCQLIHIAPSELREIMIEDYRQKLLNHIPDSTLENANLSSETTPNLLPTGSEPA